MLEYTATFVPFDKPIVPELNKLGKEHWEVIQIDLQEENKEEKQERGWRVFAMRFKAKK